MFDTGHRRELKLLLAGSLAVNFALAGAWRWRSASETPALNAYERTTVRPLQPVSHEAAPEFRWSQLETTNYFTYIANLRRIGCPEQTIRDIVSADLAANDPHARELAPGLETASKAGVTTDQRRTAEQQQILATLLRPAGNPRLPLEIRSAVQEEKLAADHLQLAGVAGTDSRKASAKTPPDQDVTPTPEFFNQPPIDVSEKQLLEMEEEIRTVYGYDALAQFQARVIRTNH